MNPHESLKRYTGLFTNLLDSDNVDVADPIITMMISYDSTRAIAVTKVDDNLSYVKMYSI